MMCSFCKKVIPPAPEPDIVVCKECELDIEKKAAKDAGYDSVEEYREYCDDFH